jgi:hypothetical protein
MLQYLLVDEALATTSVQYLLLRYSAINLCGASIREAHALRV